MSLIRRYNVDTGLSYIRLLLYVDPRATNDLERTKKTTHTITLKIEPL